MRPNKSKVDIPIVDGQPKHRKKSRKKSWALLFSFHGKRVESTYSWIPKDWYEDHYQKYETERAAQDALKEWNKDKRWQIRPKSSGWKTEIVKL